MLSGLRGTLLASCGLVFLCPYFLFAATDNTNSGPDQFEQLIQQASIYQSRGYRNQAVALLQKADNLKDANQTQRIQSGLQLARLYFELGEYPLSLNMTSRILAQGVPEASRAEALNILATVQSTLNKPKVASDTFSDAVTASELSVDKRLTKIILANHLRHELDYGKKTAAVELATRLTPLVMALGNQKESIELQISTAELFMRLSLLAPETNSRSKAQTLLERAAANADALSDPRLQSYAIGHQGRNLIDQGNLAEGLQRLSTATFLANSSRSFESAYLWQWQTARAYRLQGKTKMAVAEYQTAISTLEQVRKELINGSPFTFPQKIQPLFSELSDLLLTAARSSAIHSDQQTYLKQVQHVLEQSKSAELQDYFQNDCVIPDESMDLNNVGVATAVIYPVILPDRLEVLVNIGDQVHQFVAPTTDSDLRMLANDFRYNLQRDQGDDEYKELGKELYDMVFADAEALLKAHSITTLLIIPDGILRTIPFSAFYDGNEFLIQKFALATTPGISLTLPKHLDVAQASLFAGGISDAVQGFSALPGVPVELLKLQNDYGADVLQDEKFSLNAVQLQLGSADYSVVHIATHGHFDSNPQASYLLTHDDKFTMDSLEQSIGSRRQTGNPLELLVLSACETAVGDNRAALGLAGVALKAGARSAIATLWQISDAATVEVITDFYAGNTTGKMSKAQSLQFAQTQLIASKRFYHPSDWAPFLLIGNWL
tara:strand:+ start:1150 stop:3315 length:2166 start_codon:yes stop_codon:yes gene_type:complete